VGGGFSDTFKESYESSAESGAARLPFTPRQMARTTHGEKARREKQSSEYRKTHKKTDSNNNEVRSIY